ncbi:hypothetical protein P152DRAFT_295904 [Eremomyces bilateralis CBS 781.70]|uniref:Uncharacterized protein n=1 Tax=Eremomyces bilateralis CBS 781.70 TaxID=1392243 RepID=A0A6G1G778_9PEZI|nr:uncharacterized protein P152DRAFT_295904 [Eremomyces bilateralis CBS 781.70]KAF1813884.1 hypothetical protein P152DRAFT_295904 [Eremomyces bilateralis CBS 781.70]
MLWDRLSVMGREVCLFRRVIRAGWIRVGQRKCLDAFVFEIELQSERMGNSEVSRWGWRRRKTEQEGNRLRLEKGERQCILLAKDGKHTHRSKSSSTAGLVRKVWNYYGFRSQSKEGPNRQRGGPAWRIGFHWIDFLLNLPDPVQPKTRARLAFLLTVPLLGVSAE